MLIIDQKELLNHKELLLPNDKDVKITGTINDRHLLFLKQIYAFPTWRSTLPMPTLKVSRV